MKVNNNLAQQPVVRDSRDFDMRSGNLAERVLFNHRPAIVLLCLVITALLGFQATKLKLNASFEKMIPTHHPYVVNYLENKSELGGSENALRIG